YLSVSFSVFFFQAEDGIRDLYVTGVQTCALPIWSSTSPQPWSVVRTLSSSGGWPQSGLPGENRSCRSAVSAYTSGSPGRRTTTRSEERRVGKEGRSRAPRHHYPENNRIYLVSNRK